MGCGWEQEAAGFCWVLETIFTFLKSEALLWLKLEFCKQKQDSDSQVWVWRVVISRFLLPKEHNGFRALREGAPLPWSTVLPSAGEPKQHLCKPAGDSAWRRPRTRAVRWARCAPVHCGSGTLDRASVYQPWGRCVRAARAAWPVLCLGAATHSPGKSPLAAPAHRMLGVRGRLAFSDFFQIALVCSV